MRHPPPLSIPDHCQCSHDDPGMCSFCEWTREEDERDAHDEAFAESPAALEADDQARAG